MIEIPESHVVAGQLKKELKGKKVISVKAADSPHKFAFFSCDPKEYRDLLTGKMVTDAIAFGGLMELQLEDIRLILGEGLNLRYITDELLIPQKHQLLLGFDDGSFLIGTVQMYGKIWAYYEGQDDNEYNLVAKEKPSPLTEAFSREYFRQMYQPAKGNLSIKGFLATEQRIPGLGNGVLQDILFYAGLNPKTKIETLSEEQITLLFRSIKDTLQEMTDKGGRDTEKDLYGNPGGYTTYLSSKTWKEPCPRCQGDIVRKPYLGGNIYYCPQCQPEN